MEPAVSGKGFHEPQIVQKAIKLNLVFASFEEISSVRGASTTEGILDVWTFQHHYHLRA